MTEGWNEKPLSYFSLDIKGMQYLIYVSERRRTQLFKHCLLLGFIFGRSKMNFITKHTNSLVICLLLQNLIQIYEVTAFPIEDELMFDGDTNMYLEEQRKDILEKMSHIPHVISSDMKNTSYSENDFSDIDKLLEKPKNNSKNYIYMRNSKDINDYLTDSKMIERDNNKILKLFDNVNKLRKNILSNRNNIQVSKENLIESDFFIQHLFKLCKLLENYFDQCLVADEFISSIDRSYLKEKLGTKSDFMHCLKQPILFFNFINKNCENTAIKMEVNNKVWGGKRANDVKIVDKTKKLPFHAWGGKRNNQIGSEKIQASRIPFNAWGGKRDMDDTNYYSDYENNDEFKRSKVKFHSWGGK